MKDIKNLTEEETEKLMEDFEQFLNDNTNVFSIIGLMEELTEIYFSCVACYTSTFVTPDMVEDIDDYYEELFEQTINDENIFLNFAKKNDMDVNEFIKIFNEENKENVVAYIKKYSRDFAKTANNYDEEY